MTYQQPEHQHQESKKQVQELPHPISCWDGRNGQRLPRHRSLTQVTQGLSMSKAIASPPPRIRYDLSQIPIASPSAPIQAKSRQLSRSPLPLGMQSIPPVQRYVEDGETRKLISENQQIVLEKDHSKNLYATDAMIETAQGNLEAKKISNVTLTKGDTKDQLGVPMKKVVPKFKTNDPQKKGKGQLSGELEQATAVVDSYESKLETVKLGLKKFVNWLTSWSQTPFFKEELQRLNAAEFNKAMIPNRINLLEQIHKNIRTSAECLANVRDRIIQNEERSAIKEYIDSQPSWPYIGRDLEQRLQLFCAEEPQTSELKNQVLQALEPRLEQMEMEVAAFETKTPYLPTDCGKLYRYLSEGHQGSSQVKNPEDVAEGNYYYVSYNDDKDDDAPWPYHYALIIMRDGSDSVTLEDAAGQANSEEQTHWYYMMYGNLEEAPEQSFKDKTDAEFERRKQQQKAVNALPA